MTDLSGKHALVVGVANKRSISWAIAQALANAGARIALTYPSARLEENVRELAATLDELRRRVAAQPGVAGVTFTEDLPTTNHPKKIIEMGYDVDGGAVSSAGGASRMRFT